ncbi:MAG TPA: SDR family oxidoreductase, partial [Anaerolineaceae bacterium]|nr:SDR family oxidoreductase [Anaerolineaceae bacterium]
GTITEQIALQNIFDLRGKSALVTGGDMGIGEGIVRRLAEAGANVMISDINKAAAEGAAQKIHAAGGVVEVEQTDSSRIEDIQRVTDATVDRFGSLDILVNNAGIFPMRPVLEIEPDFWNKVIGLNLTGAFNHAQAAAKKMVAGNRGGRIINIASIDALHPTGNLVHYDSSKGGLVMMTKAMALELGRHHINVNAIAPGAIATPGASAGSPSTQLTPEQIQAATAGFMARIPMGRMGQPDDIALAVLFLASRAAEYITGELIVVDGGYLLS